jgi:cysteine desulfurase/selenocysteine lyase
MSDALRQPPAAYDVAPLRAHFPALSQTVHGKPLVYLDNGATTQKPQAVIDATTHYYRHDNANVHRGVHELSVRASRAFDAARARVQHLLNAREAREIIFTRGATEGINLVANAWGGAHLRPGDEVLITEMEHHSNIVPWQMACERSGARLVVAPINERGELIWEEFEKRLGPRTRLLACVHVSNALGTILPVAEMTRAAHAVGARVLVDGAQAVPHSPVDVQALDCDFYVFSGHKLYGPTGIGALYGKAALLEAMPPWMGGGDMILRVSFEGSQYNKIPHKFEAGTPNIAGAIGLAAAIDYVQGIGLERIAAHEAALLAHATEALTRIPELTLVGTAARKAGLLSFVLDGIHAHDIGTIMDREGVAIRAGHHCAMPAMQHFCVTATARASFGLYNTHEDIEALVRGIHRVKEIMRR